MTTKTIRLSDKLMAAVRDLGLDEHLDDATAMRKLLQLGYERHLADRYRAGAITIRTVARCQELSIGDALDLMQRLGIPGNVTADDTLASLQSLPKRRPSRPS